MASNKNAYQEEIIKIFKGKTWKLISLRKNLEYKVIPNQIWLPKQKFFIRWKLIEHQSFHIVGLRWVRSFLVLVRFRPLGGKGRKGARRQHSSDEIDSFTSWRVIYASRPLSTLPRPIHKKIRTRIQQNGLGGYRRVIITVSTCFPLLIFFCTV